MNIGYILGAIAVVPYEISQWLEPLLMILMALMGIGAIICILMQKGTNDNIGSLGGSETDTYAGKNKSKSKESVLRKRTVVFGVLVMILSVVHFIVKKKKKKPIASSVPTGTEFFCLRQNRERRRRFAKGREKAEPAAKDDAFVSVSVHGGIMNDVWPS